MSEAILPGSGEARRTGGSRWIRRAGLGLAVVAVVIGLYRAADRLRPGVPPPRRAAAAAADPITAGRRNAIVSAAEVVGPAVVSITAIESRVVRYSGAPPGFDEFFGQFFGQPFSQSYRQDVPKFGSGFIIDKKGYILTNSHVVSGAEAIQVTLADGRQFKGKVLGADPAYDIGVVKIDGDDLPAVRLGNSDDLLVGEWAIAVGNPFGYLLGDTHPTVTVGVISATNRDINADVTEGGIYKNMIQTDAAINPGNSGGALVNASGEVIGINTFIFTQSGGSLGIGFAIPIKTAAEVAREIIEHGRVRGVWVGITVTPLNPYLASRLGTNDTRGLVVYQLERGSPADQAGIQVGDIIRGVEGEPVSDARAASRRIFGAKAGDTVHFSVERDHRIRDVAVTLVPAPENR